MEYKVNVSNKFAFLSEDEDAHDPVEILSNLEQQKAKVLAKHVVKKPEPPVEKKVTIITPASANKENVEGARRGPPRRDNNDRRDGQRQRRENDGEKGRNVRPQRNERNAPRNNRPRREGADRHSGSDKTGVRPQPKKEGHGKGNWGNTPDAVQDETENLEKLKVETVESTEENVQQVPPNDDATGDESKVEEEAKKEFTLEEYKAQLKTDQPQFKVRKAGEGGDQKIYQKLVPINKRDKNVVTDTDEDEVQVKREPREKPLNIELNFRDPQRNRGYRNDRNDRDEKGGGRPFNDRRQGGNRRGGGQESSGRRNQNSFQLNNEAFPALGAS